MTGEQDEPNPWTTTSFVTALEQLSTLRDLARGLGVSNAVDQLSLLVRFVAEVVEASVRPEGGQALADRLGGQKLLWCVAEALEFSGMMPWLREYPREILARKLSEALEGPLSSPDESPKSSRGRNITSSSISRLASSKAVTRWSFLPNVDLATEIEGNLFVFQCKRPFSEGKLRKAVISAYKQLKRDIPSGIRPAWGVIAVSVSRALNPGDAVFVGTQHGRRDAIDDRLDRLIEKHATLRRSIQDPRILAMTFHLMTPAYYPTLGDSMSSVQRGSLFPLHSAGSPQCALAMRLTSALARGGWFKL